jgi:hypothetical protein
VTREKLHPTIAAALWKIIEKRNGTLPGFWEYKNAEGKTLFCRYRDLTVAICEQCVEHYMRLGRKSYEKFMRNESLRTAKAAAELFYRARKARELYGRLSGVEATEEDMPVWIENL